MKRGQSAMEFLMTYGWGIIVVLVILSALYFLGVFSPRTVSTCSVQAPFVCRDFAAKENGVILSIGSSKIQSGTVNSITVNGEECNIIDNNLEGNQIKNIECSGVELSSGKISAEIQITYTLPNSDLSHTIIGQGSSSNVEEGFIGELPTGGLIFGWAGNDSNDYINGLSGTAGGGLIPGNSYSIAPDNKATTFDGVDDYINFNSKFLPNGTLTISAWIYPSGASENGRGKIVTDSQTGGAGVSFSYISSSTRISFSEDGDFGGCGGSGTNSVPFNTWSHVVAVRNINATNTLISLYVNSILKLNNQTCMLPTTPNSNVLIGNRLGQDYTFNGIIDEVHVWNRVLSAGEINALYNYYN